MMLRATNTSRIFLALVLVSYPMASLYLARVPVLISISTLCLILLFALVEQRDHILRYLVMGKWLLAFCLVSLLAIRSVDPINILSAIFPLIIYIIVCR